MNALTINEEIRLFVDAQYSLQERGETDNSLAIILRAAAKNKNQRTREEKEVVKNAEQVWQRHIHLNIAAEVMECKLKLKKVFEVRSYEGLLDCARNKHLPVVPYSFIIQNYNNRASAEFTASGSSILSQLSEQTTSATVNSEQLNSLPMSSFTLKQVKHSTVKWKVKSVHVSDELLEQFLVDRFPLFVAVLTRLISEWEQLCSALYVYSETFLQTREFGEVAEVQRWCKIVLQNLNALLRPSELVIDSWPANDGHVLSTEVLFKASLQSTEKMVRVYGLTDLHLGKAFNNKYPGGEIVVLFNGS